ncbi:hypothetical protein [Sphingomonas sp.]|uniref:hypothetical protein n=1 Tax=Sphingomonas sp. TaxID=28214 RepID=UPI003CC5312E
MAISADLDRIADKTLVLATGWEKPTSITASCERTLALGWRTLCLPRGHEIMLEHPGEIAMLLKEAVSQA